MRAFSAIVAVAVSSTTLACGDESAESRPDGGSSVLLPEGGRTPGADYEPGPAPEWLSEAGLYDDIASQRVADSWLAFAPGFTLWSDGTEKRRWIQLPPGTTIDSSDMNEWQFPLGTKVFKEFSEVGLLLETRMLEKTGEGFFGWRTIAFVWDEEQTDARATPDGAEDVLGTEHDVPGEQDCRTCHLGRSDFLLGFTALQLASSNGDLLDLDVLLDNGWLSDEPTEQIAVPGDDLDQRVLGLLHANCGHCHNPLGDGYERNDMELWLRVDDLSSLETTLAYQSMVDQPLDSAVDGHEGRIVPGNPQASGVYLRMTSRGNGDLDMPPLGTEKVDETAVELIEQWIERLGDQ